MLEHNKNNPNDKIKFPTTIELHKWLVAIRKVDNYNFYFLNPYFSDIFKVEPTRIEFSKVVTFS